MKVVVVQSKKGDVLSVNLSVDGAAHFLSCHGSSPKIDGMPLDIDSLDTALGIGSIAVSYSDEEDLLVSVHAAVV